MIRNTVFPSYAGRFGFYHSFTLHMETQLNLEYDVSWRKS